MKKMLINAASQDEWRVAVVDNASLYDLDIEFPGQEQITHNVYKAYVSRVEPSLAAAFVDYGGNRHGFLSIKDVAEEYYPNGVKDSNLGIQQILSEGQEVIVQIDKEERGTKGAALTTYISLAGSYMVLMPNNPSAGGISRRIDLSDRDELRAVLKNINVPDGMSVIVRTAGVGKTADELQWDLDALLSSWKTIKDKVKAAGKKSTLLHQESNIILRAMRDYLRPDVDEIIVDSDDAFTKLKEYLQAVRPEYADKITLHKEKVPLFSHFHIESQAETIFKREVKLPSGGAIVIDHAEALIAIDINSGSATKGSSIEETALNTNLEAAEEIARQLRLRDLGGLIIIDFIDMMELRNKRRVENKLRQVLQSDRARIQVGSISRFGLLEMSRQRLRSSVRESSQLVCPRCNGQGVVRDVVMLTSSLLHLLEEKAAQESTAQLFVQVPTEVATYLFNEKRQFVMDVEKNYSISVVIIANAHLETPNYLIKTVTVHEYATRDSSSASYEKMDKPKVDLHDTVKKNVRKKKPAMDLKLPDMALVEKRKNEQVGVLRRLFKTLFATEEASVTEKKPTTKSPSKKTRRSPQQRQRNSNTANRRGASAGKGNNKSRSDGNRNRKSSRSRSDGGGNQSRTKSATGGRRSGGNAGNRYANRKARSQDTIDKSNAEKTQETASSSRKIHGEMKDIVNMDMARASTVSVEKNTEANESHKKSPVANEKLAVEKKTEVVKPKSALPPPSDRSVLMESGKLQQVETNNDKKDDA
ncbi:MAG: Rne/Rng family ribonuclease [Pseudomonadota bacterium]